MINVNTMLVVVRWQRDTETVQVTPLRTLASSP